ncbi:prolipoprotein diacylglyceryl transferase [Paramicrobacterium humi]|uniref:Phosphatidylglycerol--prolipoprotein diacylglyceryl transferase n=1 Tax=Paramicrobacterium humi TaxID=640635 RepID=A0A1H4QVU9_9MICO|nr:prolipoprotein diacylglyceryl transferase [Microbacterium humi]SEC23648.1 prolipoprotein diacylglyceryl transferase [Microbacterium humi]
MSLPLSIPSPDVSYIQLGPFTIHFYALCILAGIIAAAIITQARLTRQGAEPGIVIDLLLWLVPLGIIGARVFHVLTHPNDYFYPGANLWATLYIWEGGIAIFGALIGGGIGAWIGCRLTGLRFWAFADALAPGMLVAQAFGRFGNWFNHELFGIPTSLPWGLEIESSNPAYPVGLPDGTLFHPTFLYEVIWNLLGAAVIFWLGRKFTLQWGRQFALYLIWYGAGRVVWESIRIDPSEVFLGLRVNVWAALIAVVVGIVIFIVQARRHPGLQPSPYRVGRNTFETQGGLNSTSPDSDYVDLGYDAEGVAGSDELTATSAKAASPRE